MNGRLIKIETYWNVNRIYYKIGDSVKTIKIETYWNVNSYAIDNDLKYVDIKIETYWNVNFTSSLTGFIRLLLK